MRNPTNGQYTTKKGGKLKSIGMLLKWAVILAAISFLTYAIVTGRTESPTASTNPVVDATFTQEASEDPRVTEWLNSEEARLQGQLHVFEKDRVDALELNKNNVADIEATYQASLKAEKERHAEEMLKVNRNLDSVRKEMLTKPVLK